jgi:hypothetical protein
MIENLRRRIGLSIPVILKSSLVGIVEGIFFAFIYLSIIPEWLNPEWVGLSPHFYEKYWYVPLIQSLAMIFLTTVIFSKIIILWSRISLRNDREAVQSAFPCMAFSGITAFGIIFSSDITPQYTKVQHLLFNSVSIVALIALIIAIQVWFTRSEFNKFQKNITKTEHEDKDENHFQPHSKTSIIIISSLILILVVPFLVLVLVIIPQEQANSCCGLLGDPVHIERLDSNSIAITLFFSEHSHMNIDSTFFNISLDDHDVTNQDIIERQGLSISINPPTGLSYQNGSQVIFTGPDISNKTRIHHLVVNEVYPDTDAPVVMGDVSI